MNKKSMKCPTCGGEVKAGAPCPACLLGVGLESMSEERAEGGSLGWTPPAIDKLAALFPELELLELLGRGGMGAVYKARQPALDRFVAIKILPPEIGGRATFSDRFTREAQALAKLNHPNIVTVHDFGERDGLYFFMMEFVDGVNLRQLLDTGRVSAREALAIVPQICDALQCAHDQGIVHRDIKPENILMDRQGRVKIADFGLAKLIGESERDETSEWDTSPDVSNVTSGEATYKTLVSEERPSSGRGSERNATTGLSGSTGRNGSPRESNAVTEEGNGKGTRSPHTLAVVGTPAYMAPEQVDRPGQVDHRADIYALGVVFYQMLTGELPGKDFEPPSRRGLQIDVRLDEIVLQALEKDPIRRYSQVSILKTRLEGVTGGSPSAPPHTKQTPPVVNRKPRPWIWMSVFLTLHFIAIIGGLIFLTYVVPRFEAIYQDFGAALPVLTRMTLVASNLVQHWWFALIPLLLMLDGVLCLLLTLGRLRKCLIAWGWLFLLGFGLTQGVAVVSLFMVMHQMTESLGTADSANAPSADVLAAGNAPSEALVAAEESERPAVAGPNGTQLQAFPGRPGETDLPGKVTQLQKRMSMARAQEEILRQREMRAVQGRKTFVVLVPAVAVCLLLSIPLSIAAIIWIALGVKKGYALGRLALFFSTGLPLLDLMVLALPVLFFVAMPVPGSRGGMLGILSAVFICLELCAFILGIFARQTVSGKVAMIISGCGLIFLTASLLFLA